QWVDVIKKSGKGKPYDCIAGVSGGVDSTYLVYIAKQLGLRPLVVHMDNGWNSELAVKNIESVVNKLGLDLYTLVVNWDEFRDIQLAYLKASVIDIEVVTDHAISGTIARLCKKHGIRYSLTGNNHVTEFTMPSAWTFNKNDHVNLLDIHKQFGSVPIKTYPLFNSNLKRYVRWVLKTESVGLLNFIPFNKQEVKNIITNELGWRDYGGKHYESIFTKFYQAYILPEKFKVDKRKAHLSTLIFSGQLTKEQALAEIALPLYEPSNFKTDYEFVLKKFNLSDDAFKKIMNAPVRSHYDFEIEKSVYEKFRILKLLKGK
ncbi:MAG TPA: N-acetyl sugar amidotransferase, partial [Chitinophagaceae bacterium]|nr:N-acetyl sugar amidotransferase [Chitinophagaceae bacterium]